MTPQRVQKIRGQRLACGVAFVGTPTSWSNPFDWRTLPGGRVEAVERFRQLFADYPVLLRRARYQLAGRDLACWCRPGDLCHADVLLEMANDLTGGS